MGSRYATLAAGVLLIALGGFIKFDMLLVVVPTPVMSAAATLLFGIVFMHGVHMLANVDWDDRKFMVAGLALLVGAGRAVRLARSFGADAAAMKLIMPQPVISGGLTLVVLHALLCSAPAAENNGG